MDDNHLLIEWLAYHYTTLPLKRLIVAIDPRSATSPLPVLKRWKGRINYTLWYDNDYVGDEVLQKQGCNFKGNEEKRAQLANETATESTLQNEHWTWVHRLRQPMFMHACAKQLKKEHRSWTMYLDTDEYLVVNKFQKHLKTSFLQMTPQREGEGRGSDAKNNTNTHLRLFRNDTDYPPMTTLEMLYNIIKYNVTRNIQSLNHLDYHKMYQSGCIGLPRRSVSTKASTAEEMQKRVPLAYEASRFSTLRFRHMNNEPQYFGKPIIDLSRVGRQDTPWKDFAVHGGIGGCAEIEDPKRHLERHMTWQQRQRQWELRETVFLNSFFLVNHYPLTFEQYGFRKGDSRGRTSYEDYLQNYEISTKPKFDTDDVVRGWLRKFADEVGTKHARTLLRGVGDLVGDHQDLPNNYASSLSYQNCEHYHRSTKKVLGLPEDHFNTEKRKL